MRSDRLRTVRLRPVRWRPAVIGSTAFILAAAGCTAGSAAPAPVGAAASSPPAASSGGSGLSGLTGQWDGTLTCAGAPVGLHLQIAAAAGGTVAALATVYPVMTNADVAHGALNLTGTASGTTATFAPGSWSEQAVDWSAFTLTGALPADGGAAFSGTSTAAGAGCSSFTLHRTQIPAGADAACLTESLIARHEGVASEVYYDTAQPRNPTIGIGYNLNPPSSGRAEMTRIGAYYTAILAGTETLTQSQINALYIDSLAAARTSAARLFPGVGAMTKARADALADMAFTISPAKLAQFTNLRTALAAGDYAGAGLAMLDSDWSDANQTRSAEDATMMITGLYVPNACTAPVPAPSPAASQTATLRDVAINKVIYDSSDLVVTLTDAVVSSTGEVTAGLIYQNESSGVLQLECSGVSGAAIDTLTPSGGAAIPAVRSYCSTWPSQVDNVGEDAGLPSYAVFEGVRSAAGPFTLTWQSGTGITGTAGGITLN